jgi:hypothetical protein
MEIFVMAYQKEVRNAADCETADTPSLFAISSPLCYILLQSAPFYHQHSFLNISIKLNYRATFFGPKCGVFRATYLLKK